MQLQRFAPTAAGIQDFCDRALPYLQQDAIGHNLLLRVCQSLQTTTEPLTASYLVIATQSTGEIAAVALRTPPFPLLVSQVSDRGAIALLAADVQPVEPELPGVSAPEAVAIAFQQAWQAWTGCESSLYLALRLNQLTQVIPPHPLPEGNLRPAENRDRPLLIDWYRDFQQEALDDPATPEQAANWADQQLRSGGLSLWQVGTGDTARPVSVACGVSVAGRIGVINFVYTPPSDRRRDYASACVAGVSQQLLDAGHAACVLFSDRAQASVNHIYQAIGYQPVGDWHYYRFSKPNSSTPPL